MIILDGKALNVIHITRKDVVESDNALSLKDEIWQHSNFFTSSSAMINIYFSHKICFLKR